MSEGYDVSGRPIDPTLPRTETDTLRGERVRDPRRAAAGGEESLGDLVAGLLHDLQNLVRGEIALARTEIREDVRQAVSAAAMLAVGAAIGFVGLFILGLSATYGLDTWVERMWLSALIVGVALALVAAMLAMTGKNRLSAGNLKPEQTIESLKEDQEWAKRQMNSVKR